MSCAGKPGLINIHTANDETRRTTVSTTWTTEAKGTSQYADVNGC